MADCKTEETSETTSTTNGTSDVSVATVRSSQSMNSVEGNEEGDNIRYLRHAIERTINKCVSSVRFSDFAKNYPAVCKKNLNSIKSLHESYKQQLLAAATTEIDLMIEKENLEELLNNFHTLHNKNANRFKKKAWRPSGKPAKDISAHIIPRKMKHKEKLQSLLDELQRENKQLTGRLQQRRQHLFSTSQRIDEEKAGLKKSMEQLNTTALTEYMSGVQPHAKQELVEI